MTVAVRFALPIYHQSQEQLEIKSKQNINFSLQINFKDPSRAVCYDGNRIGAEAGAITSKSVLKILSHIWSFLHIELLIVMVFLKG
mmetsp:Transcript_23079/g.38709  ORF Transcript_23079/g.38709 Transcript_23079/m.38709 type:complete len:86 (-) Transcript_23079:1157-1414(-)